MIDVDKPIFEDVERHFGIYYKPTQISIPPGIPTKDIKAYTAYSYNLRFAEGLDYYIEYNYQITGNCQIGSFAYFRQLLENYDNPKEFLKWVAKKLSSRSLLKPLFLIDVNEEFADQVRDIFEDNVVMDNAYVSTNGSDMVMFLVKSQFLKY